MSAQGQQLTVKMKILEERMVNADTKFVRVELCVPDQYCNQYSNNVLATLTYDDIFNLFIDQFIQDYKNWINQPKEIEKQITIQ